MSEWPVGSPKTNKNYINDKKEWLRTRFFIQHRRVETLYPIILGISWFGFNRSKRGKKHFFMIFFIFQYQQLYRFYFFIYSNR